MTTDRGAGVIDVRDVLDVLVVGDPVRCHGRFGDRPVVATATATRFDNDTNTWAVTGPDGTALIARIVVDTTEGDDGIVAAHGEPNYFRIPGPHTDRQARYVARMIAGMHRVDGARIEARSRVRVRALLPTRGLPRFDLAGSVGVDGDTYDGPATLTHDGADHPVRVRLTGHFDPIDGRYHWQGMLYADLPGDRVTGSQVEIRIGDHTGRARISERTPWGTFSVLGVAGYPPFPLDDVELLMPSRL